MKLFFSSALLLLAGLSISQTALADDSVTLPERHASVQFSSYDFDHVKETGSYGGALYFTSIGQWDKFHVGANVSFGVNAGLVDDWGCQVEFGPSVRYDFGSRFFVNLPVNALCFATFPEGSTSTHTEWGLTVSPTLNAWITPKFGVFAGPKMTMDFENDATFGFVAGVSFAF